MKVTLLDLCANMTMVVQTYIYIVIIKNIASEFIRVFSELLVTFVSKTKTNIN